MTDSRCASLLMRVEKAAWIFLVILALFNIARGLFHAFAPDGGASTIAKLDLTTNAQNIIFLIAMIGIHQVAIGLFQLIIAWRARQFVVHVYVIDLVMLLLPRFFDKNPASRFPGLVAHNIELGIVIVIVIFLLGLRTLRTKHT